jgi:hypothetical protein
VNLSDQVTPWSPVCVPEKYRVRFSADLLGLPAKVPVSALDQRVKPQKIEVAANGMTRAFTVFISRALEKS